jgi:hypothetical protein
MAYLEGHGPSGDGSGFNEPGRDEPSTDFSRAITFGALGATAAILIASVVSNNERDQTPWTSGSVAFGVGTVAVLMAAALVYRSVRRNGGSGMDGWIAILTVMLATPMAAALGYVALAIVGVWE